MTNRKIYVNYGRRFELSETEQSLSDLAKLVCEKYFSVFDAHAFPKRHA